MPEALAYLTKKDSTLHYIVDTFGYPIIQKREEGFAALCHIILEQQVSIASAKACYEKINNHFGEINPNIISNATAEELRSFGVSRQKTVYLKHLAEKVISKELVFESFTSKSEHEIRAELLQLKGVGHWTIEVYLMFCLQAPDIIPLGDIAIKNTLKELFHCTTFEEMETVSNNWKPFRTLASFIVWHYYLEKRKHKK